MLGPRMSKLGPQDRPGTSMRGGAKEAFLWWVEPKSGARFGHSRKCNTHLALALSPGGRTGSAIEAKNSYSCSSNRLSSATADDCASHLGGPAESSTGPRLDGLQVVALSFSPPT